MSANPQSGFPGGAPAFGCAYGPSYTGKSSDAIFSFPNAFFIGAKGAISHVARTIAGIDVASDVTAVKPAQDLEGCIEAARWAIGAGFQALVVDDISVKADRTFRRLSAQGSGNGYYRFTRTTELCFELRDLCRDANVMAHLTAHECYAWVEKDSGVRILGRPDFPGNEAPIHFPPSLDYVYRAQIESGSVVQGTAAQAGAMPPPSTNPIAAAPVPSAPPMMMGQMGKAQGPATAFNGIDWPGVYRVSENDPDWYSKCRFGTPDHTPMNTAEILRAAGFTMPRPRGLEWMDAVVEPATVYSLQGTSEADVCGWMYAQAEQALKGHDVELVFKIKRWCRRDFRARLHIRREKIRRNQSLAPGAWTPTGSRESLPPAKTQANPMQVVR